MAESKQTSESHKNIGEPAILVYANNETDYEHQIDLSFTILNVNKIEKLTSPKFFIQSLPFHIVFEHEKKNPSKKGHKIDNFNIKLIVGSGIQDQWSSEFSVKFHSKKLPALDKCLEFELTDTKSTILHTIEWDLISEVEHLPIQIEIKAEQPNGGYEWPSYAATGYNGIVNLGATCYMNCLIQSLFCTNEFRRIIYQIPIEPENANESFLFWLKYIFFALEFNKLPKVTTKKFIKCFNWSEMDETSQQDVQEFLRLLMAHIEKFVEGTEFTQRLNDLFVATIKTTITCKDSGISTSRSEQCWDLQLPIDDVENIYEAFGTYLDATTIKDYQYDDGPDRVEALQEYEIVKLPSVLYIHLKRFNYDIETNISKKNNKRFDFYPTLDLSQYCDDAAYTLHSVLVHSGTLNSGHYMAFICPKADNQWYKFNDEVVTKCSAEDAIQENYGNDYRSTNAYMLVYIKTSCIPEILKDVSEKDINAKALIENEVTKEIDRISNQGSFFEIIVFTSDTLKEHVNLKSGQWLFDPERALSFSIKKDKSLGDLHDYLVAELKVCNSNSMVLWLLNMKKRSIRWCDMQAHSEKPLKTLCNKDCVHFFVELPSLQVHSPMDPFNKTENAIIFIKEYDSKSKRLIFHMHRYFLLTETVAELQEFIKIYKANDDDTENVAIMVEKGFGDHYSCRKCEANRSIGKIVTKSETQSAIIVFEKVFGNHEPKYIDIANAESSAKQEKSPAIDTNIGNEIVVIVKEVDNEAEYFVVDFHPFECLSAIVQRISEIKACATDSIQLLDKEKNIIDAHSHETRFGDYLDERNQNCRTRAQKHKNLTFLFKIVRSGFDQPMDVEITGDSVQSNPEYDVPMKCVSPKSSSLLSIETEQDTMQMKMTEEVSVPPEEVEMVTDMDEPVPWTVRGIPVEFYIDSPGCKSVYYTKNHARSKNLDRILEEFAETCNININKIEFFDEKKQLVEPESRPLERYLDVDQMDMKIWFKVEDDRTSIKRSTPVERSPTDIQRQKLQLHLTFMDRMGEHSVCPLYFDGDDKLSNAITQICDIMEFEQSNAHFFDSKGREISDFNETVSEYLKHNKTSNIEYTVINRSKISMRVVDNNGIDAGIRTFRIDESTTIGQICAEHGSKNSRVLKMLDGIPRPKIIGIVAPETKANSLLDGYTYRLDCYQMMNVSPNETAFDVCVQFISKSPKERMQTPLLISVKCGDSLNVLGIKVLGVLGTRRLESVANFEYFIDGTRENGDYVLANPDDPDFIQVVSLNMNQAEKPHPFYSYKDYKF